MSGNYEKFINVVYPIVRKEERIQKVKKRKEHIKIFSGYCGERYLTVASTQERYFTTRSVYTRHKQMMSKYEYDYDPYANQVLSNLKGKFSQNLYKYLTMYGKGYYVKKNSRMDKINFKTQNNFKLLKNPISKLVEFLAKLDYRFTIMNIFSVATDLCTQYQALEKDPEISDIQAQSAHQLSQASCYQLTKSQSCQRKTNCISIQRNTKCISIQRNQIQNKKFMCLYNSYMELQQVRGYRKLHRKFGKQQTKIQKKNNLHLYSNNNSTRKLLQFR